MHVEMEIVNQQHPIASRSSYDSTNMIRIIEQLDLDLGSLNLQIIQLKNKTLLAFPKSYQTGFTRYYVSVRHF